MITLTRSISTGFSRGWRYISLRFFSTCWRWYNLYKCATKGDKTIKSKVTFIKLKLGYSSTETGSRCSISLSLVPSSTSTTTAFSLFPQPVNIREKICFSIYYSIFLTASINVVHFKIGFGRYNSTLIFSHIYGRKSLLLLL